MNLCQNCDNILQYIGLNEATQVEEYKCECCEEVFTDTELDMIAFVQTNEEIAELYKQLELLEIENKSLK